MNNRGQSLITFVLVLPLLVLFIAFFIDSALSIAEKSKLSGSVYDNLKIALDKDIRESDVISSAIKKNIDSDITIIINEDNIKINAKSKKKSVFGNLFKLPYYNLEINFCGSYLDKKINKNCG